MRILNDIMIAGMPGYCQYHLYMRTLKRYCLQACTAPKRNCRVRIVEYLLKATPICFFPGTYSRVWWQCWVEWLSEHLRCEALPTDEKTSCLQLANHNNMHYQPFIFSQVFVAIPGLPHQPRQECSTDPYLSPWIIQSNHSWYIQ